MNQKPIENIDINALFPDQAKYQQNKRDYIADYQVYIPGYATGFFGWRDGRYEKRSDEAEANWNRSYPNGYEDWREHCPVMRVAYSDLKAIGDKINEIVAYINTKK